MTLLAFCCSGVCVSNFRMLQEGVAGISWGNAGNLSMGIDSN